MSRCPRCRQTTAWPIGSVKYGLWLAKHDCRLLRLIERPGQPGENGDDDAGLAGRHLSRSFPSPPASVHYPTALSGGSGTESDSALPHNAPSEASP